MRQELPVRAGPPERIDLEQAFLRALTAASEMAAGLNGAVLRSTNGRVLMEFGLSRE